MMSGQQFFQTDLSSIIANEQKTRGSLQLTMTTNKSTNISVDSDLNMIVQQVEFKKKNVPVLPLPPRVDLKNIVERNRSHND